MLYLEIFRIGLVVKRALISTSGIPTVKQRLNLSPKTVK